MQEVGHTRCASLNEYESGKEWMLWMMERAGKKNSNNQSFQFSNWRKNAG